MPVGSFQAVKHAAAEMLVDVEAARSAVMHGAWAVGAGEDDARVHAAIAKAVACAAAVRVADKALFLHGAVGYTWEHDLQFPFKRSQERCARSSARRTRTWIGSPAPSSSSRTRSPWHESRRAAALRRARGARAVRVARSRARSGLGRRRARAAALNWHDVIVRRGDYPVKLPQILGADGAGVRRDTGEPVVILPSLHWGADERHPGERFEILGDFTDGTYAELVAVPAENVFPLPGGLRLAARRPRCRSRA